MITTKDGNLMVNHTFAEIESQPTIWPEAVQIIADQAAAIRSLWQRGNCDSLIFVGCGSTHYLAIAAAETAQMRLGIPARAVPGSAFLLHPKAVMLPDARPLLVTISRSGTTTETIEAARIFRERYGDHVLAISCYSDRALNAEANLTLAIPAAQEQSLAQTRSFSSMLLLAEGSDLHPGR
jgi:glutamine---fructose-6-phosphate transaminase (isomerizing)